MDHAHDPARNKERATRRYLRYQPAVYLPVDLCARKETVEAVVVTELQSDACLHYLISPYFLFLISKPFVPGRLWPESHTLDQPA